MGLCLVKSLAQHLDLLAVIGADALDFMFNGLLEVFRFLLLTPSEMRFDPALPEGTQSLLLVVGQSVLNHLS